MPTTAGETAIPRLNRTLVDGLEKPGSGELIVMDSEVPSFGVRVMPSGTRSYFVRYRVGGGRAAPLRRETLGRHPIITPEKARQQARTILARARLGDDPAAMKARVRGSLTVANLVAEWTAGPGQRTRKGRVKSLASFASDKARLEHHVVPTLGKIRICDLSRAHIEQLRDAVALGRTAKPRTKTKPRGFRHVRGGEGVAARTVACFSTVLGYAVERGYLERNPALGVHKAQEKHCERFLSAAELKALGSAFDALQRHHPQAIAILRLLLLTGCRSNEIAGLTWDEVDLNSAVLRLRATKTGARVVHLSNAAVRVLASVPRKASTSFVFPATRGQGHYKGTPKVWRRVLTKAGLAHLRIHDLRHTFASTGLANGASLEVIAKLLGHREIRTTARYAHLADDHVRGALERISVAIG